MTFARPDFVSPFVGLERELARAFFRLPVAAVQLLGAMGVPMAFVGRLTGAMAIGRARVAIEGDGRWQHSEEGEGRLVLAVREGGELVDLVALSSGNPDSWALRNGSGWVLGYDLLADVAAGPPGGRLRVFGNPIEWMRHEGAGICVIDWGRKALSELRWLGRSVTLECDDAAARDALANALRWGDLPQVISRDIEGREAA